MLSKLEELNSVDFMYFFCDICHFNIKRLDV